MKSILPVVSLFIFGFGLNSAAMEHFDESRVVFRALMTEANGEMLNTPKVPAHFELSESVDATTKQPISFTFKVNKMTYTFLISSISTDSCHTVHFSARSIDAHGNAMDMSLTDNQHRVCQDFVAVPAWALRLQVPTADHLTSIDFVGTPASVIDMSNIVQTLETKADFN